MFPVCKALLIGDWYENKGGAPNTSFFLIFRHSYWRTDAPCANRGGGPNTKKKIYGALCLVSIAYWRRGILVCQYSHWLKVRCASPIFKPIAYKLRFTNRKRKYFEEKSTATLKSKQTSIATVRNHLRTLASFPTPLIFHWSLPLRNFGT
jgi:hypothetical protein